MLVPLLLLIIGIIILIIAGDWMVRGAAALARHWGVPSLIVGLTIVAFGTSAPELVVGVQSVLQGAGDLAAGNVIGSNIANVLLALGLPAIIMAIPTNMAGVARNTLICIVATLLFILLAFTASSHTMGFPQGAILFGGIIAYLLYMFRLARSGVHGKDGLPTNVVLSLVFVIVGIIGLICGGKLIVDNAVIIAEAMNISNAIIGLTIVAIGTSLPEIATVIVASYRGHSEVAIGNVLGSNVFNLFAVMGASALAGPVKIDDKLLTFDVWVMLVSSAALMLFVLRRQPIGRMVGIIFFIGYILYLLALVSRVM